MEPELCLGVLIAVLGGGTVLLCGWLPASRSETRSARHLERIAWLRVWLPLAPALALAASLCGWAFREPDQMPEIVPRLLSLMSLPFALLFARAAIRAGRSLVRRRGRVGAGTAGLIRPRILFSKDLVARLSRAEFHAALEHERAHVRHLDPLRIWLVQLATDLQWPWPQARERLERWHSALELARDEEARVAGVEGPDLASAILVAARFLKSVDQPLGLIGGRCALEERIARLLAPLPGIPDEIPVSINWMFPSLIPALLCALALGAMFGERVVHLLL